MKVESGWHVLNCKFPIQGLKNEEEGQQKKKRGGPRGAKIFLLAKEIGSQMVESYVLCRCAHLQRLSKRRSPIPLLNWHFYSQSYKWLWAEEGLSSRHKCNCIISLFTLLFYGCTTIAAYSIVLSISRIASNTEACPDAGRPAWWGERARLRDPSQKLPSQKIQPQKFSSQLPGCGDACKTSAIVGK